MIRVGILGLILLHGTNAVHMDAKLRAQILSEVELDPRFTATIVPEDGITTCTDVIAGIEAVCGGILGYDTSPNTTRNDIGDTCIVDFLCDEDYVNSDELYTTFDDITDIAKDEPMITEAVASWGLDRIDQESLPLDDSFTTSHDGTGVTVYVIDSGVLPTHDELTGRTTAPQAADFIKEGTNAADTADRNGHGTHCAGTIGGTSTGVASNANIVGVKVLNKRGSGNSQGVVAGIAWAAAQAKLAGQPAVLSLSLGGGRSSSMDNAVRAAARAGNIVVVAAGNQADDACRYSPARAGGSGAEYGVITVGATDKRDNTAGYSNYGDCVDIFGPGTDIKSSWIGGANNVYNTISGTSMATPHVAGVAATLLQKHGFDRDLAVNELFGSAVLGKIKNTKSNGRGFLQASTSAKPGAPTLSPVQAPTIPAPVLVIDDYYASRWLDATFVDDDVHTRTAFGPLAVVDDDNGFGCNAITAGKYDGKIALVNRGDCNFYTKAENLVNAGAAGVLIANTNYQRMIVPDFLGAVTSLTVPVAMLDYRDASKFKDRVTKTVVWGLDPAKYPQVTPPPVPAGTPTSPPVEPVFDEFPLFNKHFKDNALTTGSACEASTRLQYISRRRRAKTPEACAKACTKNKKCTHINYRDATKFGKNCQLIRSCDEVVSSDFYQGYAFEKAVATPAPTVPGLSNFQKYFENNRQKKKKCKNGKDRFVVERSLDISLDQCADRCTLNTECTYINYNNKNGLCDLIKRCVKTSGSSYNVYRKVLVSDNVDGDGLEGTTVFKTYFSDNTVSDSMVCEAVSEEQVILLGAALTREDCSTQCVANDECKYMNYHNESITPCTLLRRCDQITPNTGELTVSYENFDATDAANDEVDGSTTEDDDYLLPGWAGSLLGLATGFGAFGAYVVYQRVGTTKARVQYRNIKF